VISVSISIGLFSWNISQEKALLVTCLPYRCVYVWIACMYTHTHTQTHTHILSHTVCRSLKDQWVERMQGRRSNLKFLHVSFNFFPYSISGAFSSSCTVPWPKILLSSEKTFFLRALHLPGRHTTTCEKRLLEAGRDSCPATWSREVDSGEWVLQKQIFRHNSIFGIAANPHFQMLDAPHSRTFWRFNNVEA
jgi:hypothetical protein